MRRYSERFNIKQINQLYHNENKTIAEISKIVNIPIGPLTLRMYRYIKLKIHHRKHCTICGKDIVSHSYQRHYDSHWKILRTGIRCQWCNSFNLVKDGFCKTKKSNMQAYLCRDCHRSTFLNATNDRKVKITSEFKNIAKMLRFKNKFTYKQISDYFRVHHKIDIDTKTAWRWVNVGT